MAALTRWRPFDDLDRLVPRDFFARFMPEGSMAVEWNPRCDVTDEDDQVVVHAELPGVAPEDVDIEVKDSVLTIRGEKKSERTEEKDGARTYSERFFGSFQRTIALPAVDLENVTAEMKDGVLEVRLPKIAPEKPPARKIPIAPAA